MYADPFEVYSLFISGARRAFDTAKQSTLDYYKSNPNSSSSQHQKSDIKFMNAFDRSIKALEKELKKKDELAIDDRIMEFLFFMRKVSTDYLLLVKTRFALEFLRESPQFLDCPKFNEIGKKIVADQAKNMKRAPKKTGKRKPKRT